MDKDNHGKYNRRDMCKTLFTGSASLLLLRTHAVAAQTSLPAYALTVSYAPGSKGGDLNGQRVFELAGFQGANAAFTAVNNVIGGVFGVQDIVVRSVNGDGPDGHWNKSSNKPLVLPPGVTLTQPPDAPEFAFNPVAVLRQYDGGLITGLAPSVEYGAYWGSVDAWWDNQAQNFVWNNFVSELTFSLVSGRVLAVRNGAQCANYFPGAQVGIVKFDNFGAAQAASPAVMSDEQDSKRQNLVREIDRLALVPRLVFLRPVFAPQ